MSWIIPCSLPKLLQNEVHVWLVELSAYNHKVPFFETILSQDEHERAQHFIKRSYYERFVIARGLLRFLLSNYLNVTAKNLLFNYTPNGKPFVNHGIHFNISHSENLAVFAVSEAIQVGIDIEYKRDIKEFESLSKRYFNEMENEMICSQASDKRLALFYDIWVKKEAYVKATGGRLFEVLQESRVNQMAQDKVITTYPFWAHDAYAAALAVEADAVAVNYWRLPVLLDEQVFWATA